MGDFVKINPELDTSYFISIWLNILFLFGLIFISIAEMTMMHPIMTNILVLGFSMDSEG